MWFMTVTIPHTSGVAINSGVLRESYSLGHRDWFWYEDLSKVFITNERPNKLDQLLGKGALSLVLDCGVPK